MKILKPLYFTAIVIITLSACKSISNIPVPLGVDNVINITEKKTLLTEEEQNSWGHLDLATDSIPGMSVERAYKFLEGKKGKIVVVGVVDSGTDIKHKDLKDVIWVNPKEIAENGIDDDKNGYVDDINGWNFLGNIYKENAESERILKNPKLVDEAIYKIVKEAHYKKVEEAKKSKMRFEQILQSVTYADNSISKYLKNKSYTKEDVIAIKTENDTLMQSLNIAKQMFSFGLPSLDVAKTELTKEITRSTDLLDRVNLKTNYRNILGDNPQDFTNKNYGNNNPSHSIKDESHGTHVSGIIAGIRNNDIGMNGVANNVKIMAVRVVPDGDEYDKDVALGLRYAVDNGAKIINTSFGKSYSPNKQWVYDAIRYAAEHDVLIVNAAGNDGKNIDVKRTYPNDSEDLLTEISDNVLTVGAMSYNYNKNLPADFSNYGKINVDIFAPGVQIHSTTPENGYAKFSGTSMAAPSTVGVAAIIRSYYPKLTASQVKHILMNSGTKIDFEVVKPGSKSINNPKGEIVSFSELSVSGRIVNAYNAVRMADRMVNRN